MQLRKAGGAAPAQSLAERIVPATEAALHAAEALPAGVTLRGVRAVNGFVNIALAGLPDAAAAAEAAAPAAASAASSNAVEHAAAAPRHRLTLTMEPASFTEEKFLLFQRYQVRPLAAVAVAAVTANCTPLMCAGVPDDCAQGG